MSIPGSSRPVTEKYWFRISGNFYHHYLLSKLRTNGDKEYKIPKGGLFELAICPHYLSYVTRKWYMSKFEDFPKEVKALIPFVF
ncbi:hypothetical protein GOBAR_AA17323 [Gossypium barbadense]|uniref:3-oxo-5-alpha-steroid 4-dehydrogenase C-terminal domain-containing protein n=1 Tax=Gossypium barbadense TaxID=3634 RepID=A0A2P5XJ45_GOSBA|nr:hypothetical protein GOBAR_AA17323 [Gossypium barbadense]